MPRRKHNRPMVQAQGRLWPRLNRSNEERALRYNNLRAFGYSRPDAIRLRDLSDKKYMQLVSQAVRAQLPAR